eukprot:UC1_evm1s560
MPQYSTVQHTNMQIMQRRFVQLLSVCLLFLATVCHCEEDVITYELSYEGQADGHGGSSSNADGGDSLRFSTAFEKEWRVFRSTLGPVECQLMCTTAKDRCAGIFLYTTTTTTTIPATVQTICYGLSDLGVPITTSVASQSFTKKVMPAIDSSSANYYPLDVTLVLAHEGKGVSNGGGNRFEKGFSKADEVFKTIDGLEACKLMCLARPRCAGIFDYSGRWCRGLGDVGTRVVKTNSLSTSWLKESNLSPDAFKLVHTTGGSAGSGMRFQSAFSKEARLFSNTQGLEACKIECRLTTGCRGLFYWIRAKTSTCYGLNSLGGSAVKTGTNSESWAAAETGQLGDDTTTTAITTATATATATTTTFTFMPPTKCFADHEACGLYANRYSTIMGAKDFCKLKYGPVGKRFDVLCPLLCKGECPYKVCKPDLEYEMEAPTEISDRVCKRMTVCKNDEIEVSKATRTSDRQCSSGKKPPPKPTTKPTTSPPSKPTPPPPNANNSNTSVLCGPGLWAVFDKSKPTPTSMPTSTTATFSPSTKDGSGKNIDDDKKTTTMTTTTVAAWKDFACVKVTQCKDYEYETKAPTSTSDRVCDVVKMCEEGAFQTKRATATQNAFFKKHTVCKVGKEYESEAPTLSSDRVCKPYSKCNSGSGTSKGNGDGGGGGDGNIDKYQAEPGTPYSDVVCKPVTPIEAMPKGAYLLAKATEYRDAVYAPTTRCKQYEYEVRAPTKTSDRECYIRPEYHFHDDDKEGEGEGGGQLDNDGDDKMTTILATTTTTTTTTADAAAATPTTSSSSSTDACVCNRVYKPVCGFYGDAHYTYPNVCLAECMGAVMMSAGPCKFNDDGKKDCSSTSTSASSTTDKVPTIEPTTKTVDGEPTKPTDGEEEDCVCTKVYEPVCVHNGAKYVTYSNECLAKCHHEKGNMIVHYGECKEVTVTNPKTTTTTITRYLVTVRRPDAVLRSWYNFLLDKRAPPAVAASMNGGIDAFARLDSFFARDMRFGASLWQYYSEFWKCRNDPK